MSNNKNYFDTGLAFFTFLIMICSVVTISSAQKYAQYQENFAMQQLVWFILGSIIVAVICFFDFEQISKITPYVYGFGIILLIGILIAPSSIAPTRNGAKSWFVIPGVGSIQPSEYMKIFLIMMIAYVVQKHYEKITITSFQNDVLLILKIAVISMIPILLVLLQNDFGSSLVMVVITMGMIFLSGVDWRIILTFASITITVIAGLVITFIVDSELLLHLFGQYQLERIYSWLDPFGHGKDIGFQLKQSILAMGSGMIEGKGFNGSAVYIPEAHSDFIFSIVGEEYGFLGACFVLSLYFLMIYRFVGIAMFSKNDMYEFYICIGMASLFTFHVFQNAGMVSGLLPITGIPLLLMSYGGSSVLASMIGIGLVLNISLKKKSSMFSQE
ncbi:FtsW/RodA/SpoVE family cell cycle protein [Metabacillus fastidiosus]|uniref:FtsW/RodA/SpoVE family cell cycle protein n=1 Tax=Metabacillus fastidiosus TaxID=1458 RepID=A0ABU6P196_9BACI|nr:FtsW/RodA/SpoVE family cell cycle protein [Metabacillus fastidiosus]MED4403124.1 FtsW/RodA/SpoVE family cell cycle protein [Metabacillus fastidiosus]MED4455358.1 FtsW/RodA/SpoVE family cell cycle protein [Metabacillus fastidiosus]MED4461549.1 FtsW/RodA/SpoVE family cell cycle protein [Metabacillus fastidiosus]